MTPHLYIVGNLGVAVAVNLLLGLIAWKAKSITRGGLAATLIMGIPVFLAFDWPGYLLLVLSFFVGDLITRFAVQQMIKKNKAVDEKKTGARGFGALFLIGMLPLFFSIIFILSMEPKTRFLCLVAFLAALTTSLGDTVSTEMGQVFGKRTYKLITLKRVSAGTRGAVSMEGSVAGLTAIVVFAVTSLSVLQYGRGGYEHYELGLRGLLVIIFASLIANYVESTLGGIFSQFSKKPSKQLLNFTGSLIGALLAVFFTNLPEG